MRRAILFLFLFGSNLLISEGDLSLTSEVDKTKVRLDEVITFTVRLKGSYRKNPPLNLPKLVDFKIISSNRQYRYNLSSGKIEVTTKYELRLLPKKEGRLVIGPVEIKYKGKIYKTHPIEIEVVGSPFKEEKPRFPPFKRKGAIII